MNVLGTSALGWDCHAHLFGPYDRYPLAAKRSYTPNEAVETHYLKMLGELGLGQGVLVHASAYGDEHALVMDSLAHQPQLRGVLVTRPGILPSLKGLHARGVRGMRFSHRSGAANNYAGSASFEDLLVLAPTLADAGLHAQLWTDAAMLPQIADAIRALPVPLVIDHMGGFDPLASIDQPSIKTLQALLAEGRIWLKLCAYRNLLPIPDRNSWAELLHPFQRALQEANPERLIWGTDWPHLNIAEPPRTAALLKLLNESVGNAALVEKILVNNPRALYG